MINTENDKYKVLFVCAQGRLRSATAMHLMSRMYGYNTRCAGVDHDALIPLNEMLVCWADEIVVMESYMETRVQEIADSVTAFVKIRCLDIPDDFDYMDEELQALIQRRFFS